MVEGGNLGLTQAARIEFAMAGGRINTDAIDNSAGVDCSDHEVNIKILLDRVVAAGAMTVRQRDELLVEMTGEVAVHVLLDNDCADESPVQRKRSGGEHGGGARPFLERAGAWRTVEPFPRAPAVF